METYNEPIAAVLIGLLLSVSAGFRIMLPLLGVNLLAFYHVISLPTNLAWLSTEPTLIVLTVGAITETVVHFIPAAGTGIKALATPVAFAAGTLLMAVPLGDKNPLYQWTIAAVLGGGVASLTHLGVTGMRALTAPVNLASFGTFGIVWNIGELLLSVVFALLSWLCVVIGWVIGVICLLALGVFALVAIVQGFSRRPSARAVAT